VPTISSGELVLIEVRSKVRPLRSAIEVDKIERKEKGPWENTLIILKKKKKKKKKKPKKISTQKTGGNVGQDEAQKKLLTQKGVGGDRRNHPRSLLPESV